MGKHLGYFQTVKYAFMDSPVGELTLVSGHDGLKAIRFGRHVPPNGTWDAEANQAAIGQLQEYFARTRRAFDLALAPEGTRFQQQVWNQLLRIPWGETRNYGAIARAIGKPRAARAVGMANHENPIPIIIPCHRVIGASGALTGYGGGLGIKARLLELEGALPPKESTATSHSRGRSTDLVATV